MNEDNEHSRTIRLLRAWRDLEPGEEEKARVSRRIALSLTHATPSGIRQGLPPGPESAVPGQGLLFGFATAAVAAILFLVTGLARAPAESSTVLRAIAGPRALTPAGFAFLVAFAAPMILVIMPSRSR